MTIIVDKRESVQAIIKGADRQMFLEYEREDSGAKYSYDIHVICDTNPDHAIKEYRFERKEWFDFVASWQAGKLERQLEAVDGLVIELDVLGFMMATPKKEADEGPQTYGARLSKWQRNQEAAMKHLAALSANMWVLPIIGGPETTMHIMRYIERHPDTPVKTNRVKGASEHPLIGMLRAVPGINPEYQCPDGRSKGQVILDTLDAEEPGWRDDVLQAWRVSKWPEMDFGAGVRRIGPGTLATIAESLKK